MPYFTSAQSELYYRVYGKGGTALFLVHGWYQTGTQAWRNLIAHLSPRYTIFVPDLMGHGFNLKMPRDFSTRLQEDALVVFIRFTKKKYRLRKIFVAGHSYGAFAALGVAARYPKDIDGVIALSAVDDYEPYRTQFRALLKVPLFLTRIFYRIPALWGGFPYGDRLQFYGQHLPELIPGRLEYARLKNKLLPLENARRYMRSFLHAKIDWPEKQLTTPLLLIYGANDALTPVSWAKRILPHFKKAVVHTVDGVGHNVQITAPEAVSRHLQNYLGAWAKSGGATAKNFAAS